MKIWYLIAVYLHILCAALWVGGMLFLVVVLLPAIKNHPDRRVLLGKIGLKFRFVGWIALVLLLLTGLFNMHYRGISFSQLTANSYDSLFLFKLLLFAVIVIISAIHDFYIGPKSIKLMGYGDSAATKRHIKLARYMGEINLLLALTVVALGVLIVRGW